MAYTSLAAIADATKAFAADLISGAHFSRVKMAFGIEGAAVDVSASNPLPVTGTVAATLTGQSVGLTGPLPAFGATPTVNLGTIGAAATAAAQATGNASLASIDGKAPALVGGRVPVDAAANAQTIGEPTFAGIRPAATASSTATALPTLGASRRITLVANTRCFVRTGTSGVTAAADGNSLPLAADVPFSFIVPAGHTHIADIRDTADGFVTIMPLAG